MNSHQNPIMTRKQNSGHFREENDYDLHFSDRIEFYSEGQYRPPLEQTFGMYGYQEKKPQPLAPKKSVLAHFSASLVHIFSSTLNGHHRRQPSS